MTHYLDELLEQPKQKIVLDGLHLPSIPITYHPPPKKLDPQQDDDRLAMKVWQLHKAWYHRKTGRALTDKTFIRFHNMWRKAGRWLADHDIAPRVWLLWSLGVWEKYDGKKHGGLPRANWLWSSKRMKERHDWFLQELPAYTKPRPVFTKYHYKLWVAYQRAVMAVLRGDLTPQQAQEKYLAGPKVRDLLTKILEESTHKRKKIEETLDMVDLPTYNFL